MAWPIESEQEFYNNLDKSVDKYVNEMLKDDEINSLIPEPLPNLPLPLGKMDSNPTGWSFGKIGPITPRDKVM